MRVLVIRTDNPVSEVGVYEGKNMVFYEKWEAHLKLAETIHKELDKILKQACLPAGRSSISLHDLQGVVIYQGPGSFTGLRIGLSVANALAESLQIPIVGSTGENWCADGIEKLQKGENNKVVLPIYGAEVRTTTQKK